MIEKSKYYIDMMKKHFNKKLVMPKDDDKHFENSIKYSLCDNVYVDGDVKVRDHCYITQKYGSSAHRSRENNAESNHKIHIVFHKQLDKKSIRALTSIMN